MASDERNEEVSQPVMEAGQKAGKKVAEKATRKLRQKAAQAVKKGAAKVGKAAGKALAAGGKALLAALLPLLPYILGFLAIFLLAYFTYDIMVETRPKNQEFQSEVIEEMNEYSDVPDDDGYLPVESVSQGNAMVKLFYTYFSDQSYWVVTEDFDDKTKPISPLDPEVEKDQIKDKYGREEMFYLSPDALFALDELMHEGEFKAPEQFIQPVPYEVDDSGNLKLVDIYDEEEKKMNVKSTKYDKDGKPTDKKTEGVWDYGFAPVFHYKEYEEEMQYRGVVTQIQVWNKEKQATEWIPATGDDVEQKETKVTSLGDVWMIDQLVSPSGTIRNEITHEWKDTGQPWLPNPEDYSFTKKVDIRTWPLVHQKDDKGRLLYVHYGEDEEGNKIYSNRWVSHEKSNIPYKMVEETWHKEKRTFLKKVEGTRWEKVPEYEGEPDMSEITGTKYYTDYMTSYKTYLPKEVMTEFNIAERIKTTDEKLLEAITPKEEGDGATSASEVDVEGLQLGKNANGGAYMKALENLPLLEKYGRMYGVDPYLMVALTAQEAGGSHYNSNGTVKSAANIGLMQIAKMEGDGRSVTAYNFETGGDETFYATFSELHDLETNIKWGMMYMAYAVKEKDYDILTAIQGYNFGTGFTGPWSIERALEQQKYYAQKNGWGKRSPDSPLGPWNYGDAYYVPHVLRHYASPDTPVPYVVKPDGSLVTMDNSELSMGSVDAVNANILNGQTRGLWSSLTSHIKYGWNELKEGFVNVFDLQPKNAVQFHGVHDIEPRLEVNQGKSPDEAMQITMSMLAYQEGKPLSDYQNMSEDEFKERFKLMFSNPFGGTIGSSGGSMNVGINPEDYFTNGDYTSPVDKPKVITKYGFSEVDGKQVFHSGIDLTVTVGQDIKAVADGRVKSITKGDNSQIVIEHSKGTVISYAYVGEILVKEGELVRKGEVIAKGGDSSEKKGTFHFEMQQHGRTKDPTWIVDSSLLGGGGSIVIDPNAKGLFQDPFAGRPFTKTSPFGMRLHPIERVMKLHGGTDLVAVAGAGAPIHSIADGVVSVATYHNSAGYYVTVDHGIVPEIDKTRNLYTRYLHMQAGSTTVKVGDSVKTGQQLGKMGTTGSSTGDHLHFEMRLGTSPSNSEPFDAEQVFDF